MLNCDYMSEMNKSLVIDGPPIPVSHLLSSAPAMDNTHTAKSQVGVGTCNLQI